ncbi:MAG: sulfurtransferase complex subunit TusB [Pseudomonadota bacterium]
MATLHTVNQSPYGRTALARCLNYIQPGAGLLLMEDGVLAALTGGAWADRLGGVDGVEIFALGPDLAARGIAIGAVAPNIRIVDYAGFVKLAVEYDRVQSWL